MTLSYGIQLEPQFGYTKTDIDEIGVHIEKSSFDTIWVSDHMFLDSKAFDKSAFDALTVMTYLSTKFTQLRIGSLVFCNSYRHPSIMAKKIASLDNLCEGRLEVGYGAGWKEIEYNAYGIPFPSVKIRLEQLEEGLQVLKEMWHENEIASFQGKHYSLDNALCFPKPYQKPHPRLWIGTMTGGKKMLKIAAKYGNGINLAWSFTVERCKEIFQHLDDLCHQFDKKPLFRSIGFWVRLYSDEKEMAEGIKKEAEKRNLKLEEYEKRIEGALIGTPEMIKAKLESYKELGISHFIFMFPYQQELAYLDKFEKLIL
jgi:alkanesulfonate monooxygenase SsuD/methylene tetrahydromethanopterin reductase-like flavin-dependent oxidoreductase (luciferase family)